MDIYDEIESLKRQIEALKDCLRPFLIKADQDNRDQYNNAEPLSEDHVLVECDVHEYGLYVEDINGIMRIPSHAKGKTVQYKVTVGQITKALQGEINPGS